MVTSSMEPPSHCGTLLLSLLILALFPHSTTSSSLAKGYVDHCESIVPHSTPTVGTIDYQYSSTHISLQNGFFSGGDELLAPDDDTSNSVPGYFQFYSRSLHPTRTPGIFKLDGSLYLSGPGHAHFSRGRRNWHNAVVVYGFGRTANFDMTGFWSKPSGKICMVGPGRASSNQGRISLNPTAVLKLNYPEASDISTSLVNGSIESLGAADSPAHFRPVSLLAYAQYNYSYTKIPQARSSCSRHVDDDDVVVPEEVLRLFEDGSSSTSTTCSYVQSMLFRGWFELERGINASCSVLDCRLLGFEPRFMSWSLVGCSEDGRVHMYVTFSRDADSGHFGGAMHPERSFVAEGVWDGEKNRLCVLALPVMIPNNSPVADAFVGGGGNAAVGISLWLPRVLSIEMRSTMVGRIWSEKAVAAASGSTRAMISFRNINVETGIDSLPGVRYKYTRTHDANTKSCRSSSRGRDTGNGMYPDGSSIGDLRFDLTLTNKESQSTWGSAVPLSLGETFYGYSAGSFNPVLDIETAKLEAGAKPVLLNVSYKLSYGSFNSSSSSSSLRMYVDVSAEGVYNTETGTICMVGCRDRDRTDSDLHENIGNGYPMDCEISVSIQLAPMNASSFDTGIHLNGTIRSTRKKGADPLYFEPIEMSSYNMYAAEAVRTVRRMGAEVVMVLVSKTLSCVLVVVQLLHAKRRPQALPSVSVGTLVVVALGHAAHLVLNFEALFSAAGTNKQVDVLLRSGGWLEANEVVVRLTTLLALLLQLRLLQSAWSARSSSDDDDDAKRKKKSNLWAAERRALGSYCLPLYVAGALIAWLVHQTQWKKLRADDVDARRHGYSVWEALISYAGLLTDGFLLPQIVLNAVGNCAEKALSPPYYVGMTLVRSFPHVYDAYRRSHYYVPSVDSSIIFATPHEGYYSLAWDIVVPLGGVLFAVLIFLQQKLGGSFFLPKRFTSVGDGYELVSVSSI
ncbi:Uncharacterized protein M6B38_110540 [Iris pallida]|uniref:RING-type E3 ubiquitin transferase n=1 Tax=Iris pallida TaxID=29817 RepID=A0AAX6DZD5_IRIPA|nr:Uncharacterized protein M6B38_110540 [Iris pallida]